MKTRFTFQRNLTDTTWGVGVQGIIEKLNNWKSVVQKLIYGAKWWAIKSSIHFFTEQSIPASVYLDLLTEYVVPQFDNLQPDVVFQQDGAPPDGALEAQAYLDDQFSYWCIGRDAPPSIPWPPRSPDVTPLGFFLVLRHR